MSAKIKTFIDENGNQILPRTNASAVYMSDGSTTIEDILKIQPDWNQNDGTASDHIKNRPFYEISDSSKVYEGDITFSQSNGQYKFYQQVDDIGRAGSIPRIVINADGTELVGEYQNNGKFVVSYNNDIYAISLLMQLGNSEIVTLPDGSETTIWEPTTYYLQVISESGKALSDCVVYADYYYMKKIDEKYLPDGIGTQPDWNQNDATKSDYVKNRTHWIENEAYWTPIDTTGSTFIGETVSVSGMNSISQFSGMYQLSNCNKYRVTVNGAEYIAEASYDANSGYYTIDPGSLFIWFNESELNMQNNDSKISSDMSIKIESYVEAVYHPLDEKFLPDTIATKADIETHNTSTDAHTDIRQMINSIPSFTYGTEDLIVGVSELAEGAIYFVYEVPVISFTINNTEFTTKEGTTWAKYSDSVNDPEVISYNATQVLMYGGWPINNVSPTDVIVGGMAYTYSES